jgi:two-component system chemotaxis sensor kinase CheA
VALIDEVNLTDFIEGLKSSYTVPLKKPIRLDWDCPQSLPVIRTDGEKLRHILLNVIDNAVKYTEQGSVSVSVRIREGERREATGDRENEGESLSPHASRLTPHSFVEFEIKDTGIGIPKEELPRIFEMFSQVKGARTKSSSGVGLGLHIVKEFTEMLGGDARVASEEGKGSTFTITIPTGSNGHRPQDRQDPRADKTSEVGEKENTESPVPPADS